MFSKKGPLIIIVRVLPLHLPLPVPRCGRRTNWISRSSLRRNGIKKKKKIKVFRLYSRGEILFFMSRSKNEKENRKKWLWPPYKWSRENSFLRARGYFRTTLALAPPPPPRRRQIEKRNRRATIVKLMVPSEKIHNAFYFLSFFFFFCTAQNGCGKEETRTNIAFAEEIIKYINILFFLLLLLFRDSDEIRKTYSVRGVRAGDRERKDYSERARVYKKKKKKMKRFYSVFFCT